MRQIESVVHLRKVCQLSHNDWKTEPIVYRLFRKVSIYFTWFLLHFQISGNGVTLFAIVTGLLASVLIGVNYFIAGALLLLLTIILDFCDGEIARYRKQISKEGEYLDYIFHFCVNSSVFVGISIGASQTNQSFLVTISGYICVIAIFLLNMVITYAKCITLWQNWLNLTNLNRDELEVNYILRNNVLNLIKNYELKSDITAESKISEFLNKSRNLKTHKVLTKIVTFWNFPYILIIISISLLFQSMNWRIIIYEIHMTAIELTLFFYAITYILLITFFLFYNLVTKSVEKDYSLFLQNILRLMKK